MPIAKNNGGDLHYTMSGRGRPLVMVLPQSGGPLGVEPFINALAKNFMVIRYDQRGTGRSAPVATTDGMSMTARAGEVTDLLDALNIERAALCCHSTGCGIGVAVASRSPGTVDAMVLASPWAYADEHLTTMQNLRIAAAQALDPYQYAWFNASLLFPPAYRRAQHAGFERMAAASTSTPQNAAQFANRLQAIMAFDARPLLPSIATKTLVLTAEDDQLMPAWHGREMAQGIAGARFIELAGGGHMIPETRSDELATETIEFLLKP
ncbi:MAG: alpha/beta fold hydrolase [Alphaproteobacteria bacterium]|jgi:aminoacrylate hydrolase